MHSIQPWNHAPVASFCQEAVTVEETTVTLPTYPRGPGERRGGAEAAPQNGMETVAALPFHSRRNQ